MNVEEAKALCVEAHAGVFRRDGKTPYHTHPFAVADMMDTDDEKIVAYLHDVIEDTDAMLVIAYSNYYIISGDKRYELSLEQYVALQAITKGTYEPTEGYLLRVAESKLATKVKIADMFHNMATNPTDKQKNKYLNGIKILLKEV
jgi:(p)ppGpp synthase/HD superfamily hydrolase